eukprot:5773314-Amphidinium_carterae.1
MEGTISDVRGAMQHTRKSTAHLPTHAECVCFCVGKCRVFCRSFRNHTEPHYVMQRVLVSRRRRMHAGKVNKCADAWRAIRRASTREGGKARSCHDAKGVRIERLCKAQEDSFMRNLGVVCESAAPTALQNGHTTGDGNCAWRAIHKSMQGSEKCSVRSERNWKQLKKKVLAHAKVHATEHEQVQYLLRARVMGAWSSRITFAMVAAYIGGDVQVDLCSGVQRFRCGNLVDYN